MNKNQYLKCSKCGGSGQILNPVIEGAAYRSTRIKRGLSLREVARRMNISAMYLCDLERGRRAWHDEIRNKIEKAMA